MGIRTHQFRDLWQIVTSPVRWFLQYMQDMNSKEFRNAVNKLQITTEIARRMEQKMLQREQKALGDSIVLKLTKRFREKKFEEFSVNALPDNRSSYSIFIRGKQWNGTEEVLDQVIIHVDLLQPSVPILVRGLYSSGLYGDETYYSKDPTSIALMINKICERINAGGYLIRPQLPIHQPVDLTRLVLS